MTTSTVYKEVPFDFASLDVRKHDVEQALKTYLPEDTRLHQAMRYAVLMGGKRIRPQLVLASADAVGANTDTAMVAACAIECLHTYSLVHDDLPCMDDDDVRRGQPTVHKAFDEMTAVLAGDALLTKAFELLSSAGENIHSDTRTKWVVTLAKATGSSGMVEGQMQDMEAEKKALTLEELERLHANKTAALIVASVVMGALCKPDIDAHVLNKLTEYGQCIGLAFQVRDDILNVEGDEALLGKPVGTDEARHKTTYPRLIGLEKSKAYMHELCERALDELSEFNEDANILRGLAQFITERIY